MYVRHRSLYYFLSFLDEFLFVKFPNDKTLSHMIRDSFEKNIFGNLVIFVYLSRAQKLRKNRVNLNHTFSKIKRFLFNINLKKISELFQRVILLTIKQTINVKLLHFVLFHCSKHLY